MSIVTTLRVPSSDGVHTLSGIAVIPDGEIRAVLHIVHGMTEHISRYTSTMQELAKHGILAVGYDNLGHGYTAREGEHGFIASKNGYALLAEDVALFAHAVRARFGERLPYILMGHSMGSFIARYAAEKTFRPDKLILMGTGGKNPFAGLALVLIAVIKRLRGETHVSPLVDRLAFGSYNKRFRAEGNEKKLWLSTDPAVRKKYAEDPLSGFSFTVSAMGDLIRLLKDTNRAAWYKNLDTSLPILLVSGADDPVGSYGKGVREVYKKLIRTGHPASVKIYPGARHEILNDFTHDEVLRDLLAFISP